MSDNNVKNILLENNIIADYNYNDSIKYTFNKSDELFLYKYDNSSIIFCKKETVSDEITSEILIKSNNKYILCNRYNFNDNLENITSILNKKNELISSFSNKDGSFLLLNSLNYNYFHFLVDTIFITYFYYNYISNVLNKNITILVPTKRFYDYINHSRVFCDFLNNKDIKIEIIDEKCIYENIYYGLNVKNIDLPINIEFQNFIRNIFYSLNPEIIINKNKYLYISKNIYDNSNNDSNVKLNNEQHRQITNENIFIDFLKNNNFDIVELSNKNYQEKCNIMNNYEIIITHSGASALNCFFNKGTGKIFILEDEYIRFLGRNILFNKDNIIILANSITLDCEINPININIGNRKINNICELKNKICSLIT